ncbi:MAG: hypothetical protein MUF01_18565 [Bryobacterales bacterium]|jgi:hypothetical protein|nr:hypothetical protein [Bryobacterales bacterium]
MRTTVDWRPGATRLPTPIEWFTFRLLTSWHTVLLLQLAVVALAIVR